jgi:hypothetical protein
MLEISCEELNNIRGGAVSGSLINAFARGIETLLDVGRSLGNAIRRIRGRAICKI